mmetsp:Transcript_10864/g.26648  ORF Transcript_10864/g.26648 Transcript_10864/m.26648 type:complete len:158 (+) Transcript_10864:210-683(+)|eukprot:CAMPEP_0178987240 /NCGR_PEP_ID=MMETSP0795-20121207/3155_1 /TAXON_ID=88552 /ORGANISM="Amoebophrya sp., Strain Ameob2" /LENGTH=157 /DNA_ID=CAMNT_0020678401 /DNA_START=218 /DNA_END=691 /DNA_ORIENTATION=+
MTSTTHPILQVTLPDLDTAFEKHCHLIEPVEIYDKVLGMLKHVIVANKESGGKARKVPLGDEGMQPSITSVICTIEALFALGFIFDKENTILVLPEGKTIDHDKCLAALEAAFQWYQQVYGQPSGDPRNSDKIKNLVEKNITFLKRAQAYHDKIADY